MQSIPTTDARCDRLRSLSSGPILLEPVHTDWNPARNQALRASGGQRSRPRTSLCGLAECWAVLQITSDVPAPEAAFEAAKAARHAVELDDCRPEGHSAMGTAGPVAGLALEVRRDRVAPGYRAQSQLCHRASLVCASGVEPWSPQRSGRRDAIARRLDPLSAILEPLLPSTGIRQGPGTPGSRTCSQSDLWVLHVWRTKVYERQGKLEAAMKACQNAFDCRAAARNQAL
jgi:hypothetical protein